MNRSKIVKFQSLFLKAWLSFLVRTAPEGWTKWKGPSHFGWVVFWLRPYQLHQILLVVRVFLFFFFFTTHLFTWTQENKRLWCFCVIHISILRTCSGVIVEFLVFHNAVKEVHIHNLYSCPCKFCCIMQWMWVNWFKYCGWLHILFW